jgi:hypothetical protein
MNIYKTLLISSFLFVACFTNAQISIKPNCQTFYADKEHTFAIIAINEVGKSLNWNMKYAGRTLAAGKQTVPNNGIVTIKIDFPKLEKEVIVTTEFSYFIDRNKVFKRQLFFFNPNPFEGQKKALEERQVGVWDAGSENTLGEFLKDLEVPFAEVADPEQFSGKVLLVSGLDFDHAPGAIEACLKLAKQGKKVIIMPKISGKITIPLNKLDEIKLGKNNLIKGNSHQPIGIRKKFDTKNWNGKTINQKSIKLNPNGENIDLAVVEEANSFTYCELSKGKGKVILLSWDIVTGAKQSPSPVYLLKEMLIGD